ncbi:MAG: hypothetical protein ACREM2_04240 [Vulcanimicrobiaceae bacterium]
MVLAVAILVWMHRSDDPPKKKRLATWVIIGGLLLFWASFAVGPFNRAAGVAMFYSVFALYLGVPSWWWLRAYWYYKRTGKVPPKDF